MKNQKSIKHKRVLRLLSTEPAHETAAAQGMLKRLKHINERAFGILSGKYPSSSQDETTASLALSPVITAAVAFQPSAPAPKPRGEKNLDKCIPIRQSRL